MTVTESLACSLLAVFVVLALGASFGVVDRWWPAALALGLIVFLVEAE